jgi:RHS repeat-associated protein
MLASGMTVLTTPAASASVPTTTAAPTSIQPTANPPASAQTPAPAPEAVTAAKKARTSGRRVEVMSMRTAKDSSYVNPDGTITAEESPVPVHVEQDGVWSDVDTSLVSDTTGVHPAMAPISTLLSKGGTSTDLVTSALSGGRTAGLGWPGRLPAPTLSGATATYVNALPGTNLVVLVSASGYEFSLVVKSRLTAAFGSVSIPLHLTGLTPMMTAGGNLQLKDVSGAVVLQMVPPSMSDAAVDSNGAPAHSSPVAWALQGDTLILTPAASFLTDPATVYPVTIDPSMNYGVASDTYIQQSNAGTNFDGSNGLLTGSTTSGADRSRSLMTFNTGGFSGKHIISATLSLWDYAAGACYTGATSTDPLNVLRITGAWSPSAVTWTNGSSLGTSTTPSTPAIQKSLQPGNASCPVGTITSDLTSDMVDWATGVYPNYGIMLEANSETNATGYRNYYSSVHAGGNPQLSVTYNTPPGTVSGLAMAPCNFGCSGSPMHTTTPTPTLSGTPSDADGDLQRLDFQVYNSTGTTLVTSGSTANVTAGTSGSWAVPPGTLSVNGSYKWRVRSYDGNDYSAAWSAWVAFTVDPSAPTPPTTVSATASGERGAIVTWTAPSSDGGSPITGYTVTSVPASGAVAVAASGPSTATLNLTPGKTYRFRVTASNAVGATPSGLSAALPVSGADLTNGAFGAGAVSDVAGSDAPVSQAGTGSAAGFNAPTATVGTAGAVYTATADTIMRTDPATGATTILAGTPGSPSCTDGTTGAASGVQSVNGMTSDGTNLYTVGACGLRSINLSSGATSTIISANSPYTGAQIFGDVTLATSGGRTWLFVTHPGFGTIEKIDQNTGAAVVFYTYPDQPADTMNLAGMTSDATSLFVIANTGTLAENFISVISLADASRTNIPPSVHASQLTSVGGYLYLDDFNDYCRPSYCTQAQGMHVVQIAKSNGARTFIAGAGQGHQNGTGTKAWFTNLTTVSTDGTDLYVTDGNRLRRVKKVPALPATESPSDNNALAVPYGKVVTVAGNGSNMTTAGTGIAASFNGPSGMAIIGKNAYVSGADAISKVDLTTGQTTLLAGQPGSGGDADALDGPDAQIEGGAMTTDGTFLYTAQGDEIRRVDVQTGATSLLSNFGGGGALAFGADGNLYQGNVNFVDRIDPSTGASTQIWSAPTSLAVEDGVAGVAADASGLWVAHIGYGADNGPEFLFVAHISYAGVTLSADTYFTNDEYLGPLAIVSAGDSVYLSWSGISPSTNAALPTVIYRLQKNGGMSKIAGGGNSTTDVDGTGTAAGFSPVSAMASDGINLYTLGQHLLRTIIAAPQPATVEQPTVPSGADLYGGGNPSSVDASCRCPNDPVQINSGSLLASSTDLSIPGRGPAMAFSRSYDSARASISGPLGFGWAHGYDMHLTVDTGSGPTAGQVTIRQENGSTIAFTPDGNGGYTAPSWILATLVSATGSTWSLTREHQARFTFSSSGLLTAVTDLNGNTESFAYDGSNRLHLVTDASGHTLTFSYTDTGHPNNITAVTDSASRVVHYTYDSNGDLHTATDVTGQVWTMGYTSHKLTTIQDPRGNTTTNTYDPTSGQVTQQQDRRGNLTHFSYGAISTAGYQTTTMTTPDGRETAYVYADGGLLTSVTNAAGTAMAATTSYTYDPATLAEVSVTDPDGDTTQLSRDAQGSLLSSVNALGNGVATTYNNLAEPLTVTDANGVTTTNVYDSVGNLDSTSTPTGVGTTVRLVVYHHGTPAHPEDVTSMTDPDGNTTLYTYDSYGQLTSTTDPLGNKTTTSYVCTPVGPGCRSNIGLAYTVTTPKGNVSGGTPASYTTTNAYNDAGQITQVTDPLGRVSKAHYDADGHRDATWDPSNNETQYTYNANNQLTVTTRPDTTTIKTGYDEDGNVTSQTNGANQETQYTVNALDLVSLKTDPDLRTTSYIYDAAGQPTVTTTDDTQTVTDAYDSAGKLTAVDYSDPATHDVSYSYDANGNRTQMTDGTGTSHYVYDNFGQLTSSTDGAGNTTGYGYDAAGNLTSLTYPNSLGTVTRGYDADNRLDSVTDLASRVFTYHYDPDSNPTEVDYPTTVKGTQTYDATEQLTGVSYTAGALTLATFSNGVNANGLTTALTTTGTPQANTAYGYNNLDHLNSVAGNSLSYDQADNVTTLDNGTTQLYDAAGQLESSTPTSGPSFTYGYDQRGNRVSANPSGGTATVYGYDQANDLTSIGTGISYSYGGDGQRTSKTVSGGTSNFTYDNSSALPLTLTDGTNVYIYGLGDTPLEQVSGGMPTYLHADVLGSVRLLTDSTGTKTASFSYTAYGQPGAHTGTGTSPFGFAGEYSDSESGLQYLRARYYDPATGNFLTADPLEDITGAPYSYAGDDPVDGRDPSGMCWLGPQAACDVADYVSGYDTYKSFSSCLNSNSGYDCAVMNFDPAYIAVEGYSNEWEAVRNGCPAGTIFKDGLEGVLGVASTAAIAVGGAGALDLSSAEVGFRDDTAHIFRQATGHLADDTPANRAIIHGAIDPSNLRSTITSNDGSTLKKYFKTLPNGTQAWAEVRNGKVTNGGLNVTPR